jgi:hypothetical protein
MNLLFVYSVAASSSISTFLLLLLRRFLTVEKAKKLVELLLDFSLKHAFDSLRPVQRIQTFNFTSRRGKLNAQLTSLLNIHEEASCKMKIINEPNALNLAFALMQNPHKLAPTSQSVFFGRNERD